MYCLYKIPPIYPDTRLTNCLQSASSIQLSSQPVSCQASDWGNIIIGCCHHSHRSPVLCVPVCSRNNRVYVISDHTMPNNSWQKLVMLCWYDMMYLIRICWLVKVLVEWSSVGAREGDCCEGWFQPALS